MDTVFNLLRGLITPPVTTPLFSLTVSNGAEHLCADEERTLTERIGLVEQTTVRVRSDAHSATNIVGMISGPSKVASAEESLKDAARGNIPSTNDLTVSQHAKIYQDEAAINASKVDTSSSESVSVAIPAATSLDTGSMSDSSRTTDPEAYQPARQNPWRLANRRSGRGKGGKANKKAKKQALREKENEVEKAQGASGVAASLVGVGSCSGAASRSGSVIDQDNDRSSRYRSTPARNQELAAAHMRGMAGFVPQFVSEGMEQRALQSCGRSATESYLLQTRTIPQDAALIYPSRDGEGSARWIAIHVATSSPDDARSDSSSTTDPEAYKTARQHHGPRVRALKGKAKKAKQLEREQAFAEKEKLAQNASVASSSVAGVGFSSGAVSGPGTANAVLQPHHRSLYQFDGICSHGFDPGSSYQIESPVHSGAGPIFPVTSPAVGRATSQRNDTADASSAITPQSGGIVDFSRKYNSASGSLSIANLAFNLDSVVSPSFALVPNFTAQQSDPTDKATRSQGPFDDVQSEGDGQIMGPPSKKTQRGSTGNGPVKTAKRKAAKQAYRERKQEEKRARRSGVAAPSLKGFSTSSAAPSSSSSAIFSVQFPDPYVEPIHTQPVAFTGQAPARRPVERRQEHGFAHDMTQQSQNGDVSLFISDPTSQAGFTDVGCSQVSGMAAISSAQSDAGSRRHSHRGFDVDACASPSPQANREMIEREDTWARDVATENKRRKMNEEITRRLAALKAPSASGSSRAIALAQALQPAVSHTAQSAPAAAEPLLHDKPAVSTLFISERGEAERQLSSAQWARPGFTANGEQKGQSKQL